MTTAETYLVDANIVLRFFTNDHPKMAAQCEKVFLAAETGQLALVFTESVISDVVWTLQKFYKVERSKISALLLTLLEPKTIKIKEKTVILAALSLYGSVNADWTDCLLGAFSTNTHYPVLSYDKDFRKFPGMTSVLPGELIK